MKYCTICLAVIVFLMQSLTAQVPQTLSYQGVLASSEGNPAGDGSYEMQFNLYTESESGSSLWSETQTVYVSEGVFNVILGSENPLNLPFNELYYLGISINGDPELSPRLPLTASAYSHRARYIEEGKVVTSLNMLKDDVILEAGENIMISEDGNTIVISATGDNGGGSITEIIAGAGLEGGGTEGEVTLSVADGGITNQKLADGSVTPGKIVSIPAASATSANNLNVNNNSVFTVPLNATFFDTANIHNAQINNTRLVAPIDGIYQVSATVTWSANNNGTRTLSVRHNNAARISDVRSAAGFMSQNLSGLLRLNGGEFVELVVFQDSGATLELSSTAPLRFEMVWVGPAN